MTAKGILITVSAPSGAGKTSLVNALVEADSNITLSISYTTRPMKEGEVNGRDYHFVSEQVFMEMCENGAFLETAEVFGRRYGTERKQVEALLDVGRDVVLEIDWQGAFSVKSKCTGALGVFVLPPSLEVLKSRLFNRNRDLPKEMEQRLVEAQDDIRKSVEFEYVVINDVFEETLMQMQRIIEVERLRVARRDMSSIIAKVLG